MPEAPFPGDPPAALLISPSKPSTPDPACDPVLGAWSAAICGAVKARSTPVQLPPIVTVRPETTTSKVKCIGAARGDAVGCIVPDSLQGSGQGSTGFVFQPTVWRVALGADEGVAGVVEHGYLLRSWQRNTAVSVVGHCGAHPCSRSDRHMPNGLVVDRAHVAVAIAQREPRAWPADDVVLALVRCFVVFRAMREVGDLGEPVDLRPRRRW